MQQTWRSMSAALILVTATVIPSFAGPNEHASEQGKDHASEKSMGDQQQPSGQAVKRGQSDQAQPAAVHGNTPKGTAEGYGKGKKKGHAKDKDEGHAE